MTLETLTLVLTCATMIVSSLGVLAIRHGSKRYVLLVLASLFVIAIAFIAPHYAEAGDLFILWRLMIMAIIGAASLVILVVCTIFGAVIGGTVVLGDVLLAKKGTRLPLWFTVPICIAVALSIGLTLDL